MRFKSAAPQRNRQIRWQGTADAEAASHLDDVVDPDFLRELHGRYVARSGQGAAQRDHALVSLVIVVRGVRLSAAHDRVWSVEDGVEGGEALLQALPRRRIP